MPSGFENTFGCDSSLLPETRNSRDCHMKRPHPFVPRAARHGLAVAVVVFSGFALGQGVDENPPNIQLSGFGSLGASHSSTDFGGTFIRDVSQMPGTSGLQFKSDTRLGAQVNWGVTDTIEAVGQVVLRDRPSSAKPADAVEWAFLAYRPSAETTWRAGRISADLYLLSDYRNVGFGYLAVRPPPDFYGVMSLSNLDGVDISHHWRMGDADWRVKGAAGQARYDVIGRRFHFKQARELVLSREHEGLTLRGTLAAGHMGLELDDLSSLRQGLAQVALAPVPSVAAQAVAMSSALNYGNVRVRYASLGLAYDRANWLVNAEWMRISTSSQSISGTGAYVMAGHRFGAFTPYVGLSRARSLSPATTEPNWGRDLMPLAPLIGTGAVAQAQALGEAAAKAMNAFRVHQHTRTLGLRWDINPGMSLKLQWDRVKVQPKGNIMWGGQTTGGSADVGSVVLDFVY